ncbi:MAG: valyl-tRNA synthetase [Fibrobacteres bacterium]|nr:valyl-tRNA synthetase [Fibrobacterota bacterium]
MDSRYSPQDIEEKWYRVWREAGAFKPQGPGKPFTIVIPPPNVTGALHMGHALNNTLQDVLIRFKRLQGYRTLWQPGTDHAGIATQSVVEKQLAKEGVKRQDLGREKFVAKVWEWKTEYGDRIVNQLMRLGSSCDWSRLRFTMDEGLSKAVREVFVRLHEEGLIYRGTRLINWDPKLQTALADEEVDSKETKGHFWSIRYPLADNPSETITVSTTRPETMFGDVAVAVNGEDERYKHLIGKQVRIPGTDRTIPIIADEHADPTKGTGAVKITPAHDFNDYEVGKRHNLTPIIAMNLDATLNHQAGKYQGMNRFVARKAIVADLEAAGLLAGVEDRVIPIPYCYRSEEVVEPYLLDQWFVNMKPLAVPALEAVEQGRTRFVPARYTKTYRDWLEPFKDWCISRQLWWGHQIPAWYVVSETDGKRRQDTPFVVARSVEDAKAEAAKKYGPDAVLVQEEDVLDTWFSSALWPFSTLGWPDKTPELATHYPTDVLVTDRGIIYFWVARMIFSGLEFLDKEPFHTVYIHGTILDEKGQRMSKSKGNGIDPIEMIEKYGADAMRFALMILTTEGQDIKLSPVKFETGRNFANKLWNAVRFVLPHLEGALGDPGNREPLRGGELHLADRWILARLDETIKTVTESLEPPTLRFSEAAQALYRFTWDDFCSSYLEIRKKVITADAATATPEALAAKKQAVSVFATVLEKLITLLHPFMPFITEEIRQALGKEELLITSKWPEAGKGSHGDAEAKATMELLLKMVDTIRAIRGDYTLPPSQATDVRISCDSPDLLKRLQPHADVISSLEKVGTLVIETNAAKPAFSAAGLFPGGRIFIPLEGILDPAQEKVRLTKELGKAESFAAAQEKKLSNDAFVKSAPADVVDGERTKLQSQKDKVEKLKAALADLG